VTRVCYAIPNESIKPLERPTLLSSRKCRLSVIKNYKRFRAARGTREEWHFAPQFPQRGTALTRPVATTMLDARFTFHASSMAINTRALSLRADPLRPPCYIPPLLHSRTPARAEARAREDPRLACGRTLRTPRGFTIIRRGAFRSAIVDLGVDRGATRVNRTLPRACRKSSGKPRADARLVAACDRRSKRAGKRRLFRRVINENALSAGAYSKTFARHNIPVTGLTATTHASRNHYPSFRAISSRLAPCRPSAAPPGRYTTCFVVTCAVIRSLA